MQRLWLCSALLSIALLPACTQKESGQASTDANSPQATIQLRDGTKVTGSVRSSTPTEITLNLDSGGSRTVLTKDVKSVEYSDAASNNKAQDFAASGAKSAAAPANAGADAVKTAPAETRNPSDTTAPSESRYHPDRAAIQTKTFEVPVGTEISVRNDETIDSGKATESQTYAAEVTSDVRDAHGDIVIPRGANAQLIIRSASSGGRIRGASDLVLDLKSVSVDGQQYAVETTDLRKQGSDGIGTNKRTGEYVGGGAALGAIIGAIAGHGKGAAIGAASGAGAGAVTQVLTKGDSIKVPAETLMTFKLEQALRVKERK
jgi:hypothetical protein